MSGMKAALFYPTWPDMQGEWIPAILFRADSWTVENLVEYDRAPFMAALVQLLHRTTAYTLTIIMLVFGLRALRQVNNLRFRWGIYVLITVLIAQVTLGILTVINSVGTIPVGLGVFHQAVAIILLSVVLFLWYPLRKSQY